MKVKILTAIWDGEERIEADVIRDRKDGEELVRRGLAEKVKEPPKKEE